MNHTGNIPTECEEKVEPELARTSELPKDSDRWNEIRTAQTTTLVAASSLAISFSSHAAVCVSYFLFGTERFEVESNTIEICRDQKVINETRQVRLDNS